MGRMENRVAVVTGGARGIGAATARKLAQEGAKVAVFDLLTAETEETVARIRESGADGIALPVDVTDREQVARAMEKVVETFGRLDILVNNAGVLRDNLLEQMTEDDWDFVIDVNLKGGFLCTQAAQKYMMKQKYGKIVFVSSAAATGAVNNTGRVNYSSAKAGIQGLTKALSYELGPHGINVNAVAPGYIETEMSKVSARFAQQRGLADFEQQKQAFIRSNPIPRVGQPEDVANVIAFLASDEAGYVTGQVIYVAGRAII